MRDFEELAARLAARFSSGDLNSWPDFDERAFEAFSVQYGENAPYRALCDARGIRPENLDDWRDAPLVPATAFKHMDLIVGRLSDAEAVFVTSGTTSRGVATRSAGPQDATDHGAGTRPATKVANPSRGRGRHLVRDLDLYRASLRPSIGRFLFAGLERPRMLSLIPSADQAVDSSLSFMVQTAAREFCSSVVWAVGSDGSPDPDELTRAVAADRDTPVVLVGTAFAFVHFIDRWESERSVAPRLPEGSRVMETGGFKGRSRTVTRDDLHEAIALAFGIPTDHIVNEYGMTELLSQLYEPTIEWGDAGGGVHVPPPWLAVRALDPLTLDDLGLDRDGLLAFYDLANVGSVSAILTQDVGSVGEDGIRLVGRSPGAEPRGCSLALDALLSATGASGL